MTVINIGGGYDTQYRLAWTYEEPLIKVLLQHHSKIQQPIAVAIRNHKIVGAIATHKRGDAVVAGPMWVDNKIDSPGLMVAQLVDTYEAALAHCGVTSFYFSVDKDEFSEWLDLIVKSGVYEVIEDNGDHTLFKREFEFVEVSHGRR